RDVRGVERSRAPGAGIRAAREDRHSDRRRSRPQPVQGLREQPHPGRARQQEGGRVAMNPIRAIRILLVVTGLATLVPVGRATAAEGEMRWGLHVTRAANGLDPAETEAFTTPFMILYEIGRAHVYSS